MRYEDFNEDEARKDEEDAYWREYNRLEAQDGEEHGPQPERVLSVYERAYDALEEIRHTGLNFVKDTDIEAIITGLLDEVDKLSQHVDWLSHRPTGLEEALNSGDGSYKP